MSWTSWHRAVGALAASAALLIPGLAIDAASTVAEARDRQKNAHSAKSRTWQRQRAYGHDRPRFVVRREYPLSPGDVDLNAPGGVELFFELTRRYSR
ncbi:MAG: hypothetical protein NW217_10965 [Hyphomicrobiaceae bacterium]|nr:hypothetical protein [Hyphomicrobiaceae bacterium]